jgi:hypothetical protein
VVKETWPPVPEDQVAREARRLLAAQKKEEKDAAKKRQVHKALEQEALKKHRRQQSLDGLPLKESPSEMVSGRTTTMTTTTPSCGTTPRLPWRTSLMCALSGAHWAVDLLGIDGGLGTR